METITRGNVKKIVSATGTINPINVISVGSRVSGTIEKIYVDYNDKVKKGQKLAVLDVDALKNELNEYKSYLAQKKSQLKYVELNTKRTRELYKNKYIAKAELDQAETELVEAKENYNFHNDGKNPTVSELSAITDLSEDIVRKCLKHENDILSLNSPVGELEHGEQSELIDFIVDDENTIEHVSDNDMLKIAIKEVLEDFDPRLAQVIIMRFGLDGKGERTLAEVGEEFNLTRERIRQIENKALKKLRSKKYEKKLKDYAELTVEEETKFQILKLKK